MRKWHGKAIVAATLAVVCGPLLALGPIESAQAVPPSSAHLVLSQFRGPGHVTQVEPGGVTSVNVCSTDVPPGAAQCDARVVTSLGSGTTVAVLPASTSTSKCSTSDVNAPPSVLSGGNGGYDPCYLQSAYDVAARAESGGGAGQIVAVVDYTVDPNVAADLAVFRSKFGLPACPTGTVSPTKSSCVFQQVSEPGAPPSGSTGWDFEIAMDVEAISAMCPSCQILLVDASQYRFTELGKAVATAVADGANVVSNSFGGAEQAGESTLGAAYFDYPGVAVVASSGDTAGKVQFPASAPNVVAVGGTTLLQHTTQGTRSSNTTETVWKTPADPNNHGSGAGCSIDETPSDWQRSFLNTAGGSSACAHRVVADVSIDGDPASGMWVYDSLNNVGWRIGGGTSLAAPLLAGIFGLASNSTGSSVQAGSALYANSSVLSHVTSGSVGSCGTFLCDAAHSISGYNGPTGLGTPGTPAAMQAFNFYSSAAPAVPTGVSVSAVHATSAKVAWSIVPNATSYDVYVQGVKVMSGLTQTSTSLTDLTPQTAYAVSITAVNEAGESVKATAATFTTPVLGPASPTNVSAAPGNKQAVVSFTGDTTKPSENGSAIVGYTVTSADLTSPSSGGQHVAGTSGPITVTGLTNGHHYTFTVTATNADGTSPPSSASNDIWAGAPGTPGNAVSTPNTDGSVTVSWSAAKAGASSTTGYVVSSSTQGTFPATASSTSLVVRGLTLGKAQTFTVAATNRYGTSVPSGPTASVTPLSVPSAPTAIKAVAGNQSVVVSWTAPVSDGGASITRYYVKGSPNGKCQATTVDSCTVTGIPNGVAEKFTVVAQNQVGKSPASAPSSTVTPARNLARWVLGGIPSVSEIFDGVRRF